MIYFDVIKKNLVKNFESTTLVNSLLLKILFHSKTEKPLKINFNFKEAVKLLEKPTFYNFTKILKPGKLYISDIYSENIIYEFILNIYFPIFFVSFILLLKVINIS